MHVFSVRYQDKLDSKRLYFHRFFPSKNSSFGKLFKVLALRACYTCKCRGRFEVVVVFAMDLHCSGIS